MEVKDIDLTDVIDPIYGVPFVSLNVQGTHVTLINSDGQKYSVNFFNAEEIKSIGDRLEKRLEYFRYLSTTSDIITDPEALKDQDLAKRYVHITERCMVVYERVYYPLFVPEKVKKAEEPDCFAKFIEGLDDEPPEILIKGEVKGLDYGVQRVVMLIDDSNQADIEYIKPENPQQVNKKGQISLF